MGGSPGNAIGQGLGRLGTNISNGADQFTANMRSIDPNPQHSDPGQLLQKTGFGITDAANGNFNKAGQDFSSAGGNLGRTAAGVAALFAPEIVPALADAGGAYAGLGSTAADVLDTAATGAGYVGGAAADSGMVKNEAARNSPSAIQDQNNLNDQQNMQRQQKQQQQISQQDQQAQQQALQGQQQQANQGQFDQTNGLENALRNAYLQRKGSQSNANGYT